MKEEKRPRRRKPSVVLILLLLLSGACAGGWLLFQELYRCEAQARHLHNLSREMTFYVGEGPARRIIRPPAGPYDRRLGYASLGIFTRNLFGKGFQIARQARASDGIWEAAQAGIFPIYKEKTQAGLRIIDRNGRPLFHQPYPARVFHSFSEIPPQVVAMLLFVENRELLDEDRPFMNPAVEWDRLGKAVLEKAAQLIDSERSAIGGSTLATQLEKFRHSESGITDSVSEKLRQMTSASLRSYMDGEYTIEARKRIVLDYVNSIPLAALPGHGEIHGLGDGLWAWYGTEFDRVREVLAIPDSQGGHAKLDEKAFLIKQVLSLMIAQRRPTEFLLGHRDALRKKCNAYIRLLSDQGILSPDMRDRALRASLRFRVEPPAMPQMGLVERKAANPVRTSLLVLLGVDKLYDLDRMDLEVKATLDLPVQTAVTHEILKLKDPQYLAEKALRGARLLEKGDPAKVIYSLVLYEKTARGNLLRLQTDNYDLALNINEGVKLDLGSTAKLRTLIHYLEIIAFLHEKYGNLSPQELRDLDLPPEDRLTQWAVSHLSETGDRSLEGMLHASLQRTYSANPGEGFFTGGGMHTFENFDRDDNRRILTVHEGFKNSVNLVFIRLMRDIVRHHIHRDHVSGDILRRRDHPLRKEYVARFADLEGKLFLERFYPKYKGKSPEEAFQILLQSVRPLLGRLAIVFRYVHPKADPSAFRAFLENQFPESEFSDETILMLHEKYAPGNFTLPDAGWVAHIHPLELWLVAYIQEHGKADLSRVLEAGRSARQEVYTWLFRTSHKGAQDIRIKILLEIEAFLDIHKAWQRLGYPFGALVPSYATAIGASADRPAALAELIGIVVNDGIRMPMVRVEEIAAAADTPYEVCFSHPPPAGEQVLDPEIVKVVRELLLDVVRKGTGIRANRSFVRQDGSEIPVGGKTGTGDHRYEIYGKGGALIASKVKNRTATFAFMIGDRFFGTITAFVPGAEAADYGFTSSLPLAVLKTLAPTLMPLVDS